MGIPVPHPCVSPLVEHHDIDIVSLSVRVEGVRFVAGVELSGASSTEINFLVCLFGIARQNLDLFPEDWTICIRDRASGKEVQVSKSELNPRVTIEGSSSGLVKTDFPVDPPVEP